MNAKKYAITVIKNSNVVFTYTDGSVILFNHSKSFFRTDCDKINVYVDCEEINLISITSNKIFLDDALTIPLIVKKTYQ